MADALILYACVVIPLLLLQIYFVLRDIRDHLRDPHHRPGGDRGD